MSEFKVNSHIVVLNNCGYNNLTKNHVYKIASKHKYLRVLKNDKDNIDGYPDILFVEQHKWRDATLAESFRYVEANKPVPCVPVEQTEFKKDKYIVLLNTAGYSGITINHVYRQRVDASYLRVHHNDNWLEDGYTSITYIGTKWRSATMNEIDRYNAADGPVLCDLFEESEAKQNEFKKDDYIVILKEHSTAYLENYIYQQRQDYIWLRTKLDSLGSTANGHSLILRSEEGISWRKATTEEILKYTAVGFPVSVNKYEPKVDDYVKLISKRRGAWNNEGLMDKFLCSVQKVKSIDYSSVKFVSPETERWGFTIVDVERQATYQEYLTYTLDNGCVPRVEDTPVYKVGDWIILSSEDRPNGWVNDMYHLKGTIQQIKRIDTIGNTLSIENCIYTFYTRNIVRLATPAEIPLMGPQNSMQKLIDEAKRRYPTGTVIKGLNPDVFSISSGSIDWEAMKSYSYKSPYIDNNKIFLGTAESKGSRRLEVYDGLQWAEIGNKAASKPFLDSAKLEGIVYKAQQPYTGFAEAVKDLDPLVDKLANRYKSSMDQVNRDIGVHAVLKIFVDYTSRIEVHFCLEALGYTWANSVKSGNYLIASSDKMLVYKDDGSYDRNSFLRSGAMLTTVEQLRIVVKKNIADTRTTSTYYELLLHYARTGKSTSIDNKHPDVLLINSKNQLPFRGKAEDTQVPLLLRKKIKSKLIIV